MSQHHTAAGWTKENQKIRARLKRTLPASCSKCGFIVHEDQLWDVDHLDGIQNSSEVGVAHRSCNRSAGGKEGAAIQARQRRANDTQKRTLQW